MPYLIYQVLLPRSLETIVSTLLVLGSHHRLRVRLRKHCNDLDINSWFETSAEQIALAFNKTHRPEYIIIEYGIHDAIGSHLCQNLKEDNPDTRIIIAHATWVPARETMLLPAHADFQTTIQHSAKRLARHLHALH